VTKKLHENPNILIPMDLLSFDFDGGFKKCMGILVMEFLF
jgi:hypothetical protein